MSFELNSLLATEQRLADRIKGTLEYSGWRKGVTLTEEAERSILRGTTHLSPDMVLAARYAALLNIAGVEEILLIDPNPSAYWFAMLPSKPNVEHYFRQRCSLVDVFDHFDYKDIKKFLLNPSFEFSLTCERLRGLGDLLRLLPVFSESAFGPAKSLGGRIAEIIKRQVEDALGIRFETPVVPDEKKI